MNIEQLIKWLQKEISRCEKEIEKDGPFYVLEAEKEAYEIVLEKIQ